MLTWLLHAAGATTVPPTWTTSNYFRAGYQNVIDNVLTGDDASPIPSYEFTFTSALTGTPELGYGIKDYEPDDYLGEEFFEIERISLTSSTFKVQVQIVGYTHIWVLGVSYIAVEPTFPHHLNSFDNVPVNYSAGNMVNITAKQPTAQTYTNIIDYSVQAAGRTHSQFSLPLSNNKIMLFMTTFFEDGEIDFFGSLHPIDFYVETSILSTTTYSITVTIGIEVLLQRLHFSQIIFDQVDVEASRVYTIVAQQLDAPDSNHFIEVPAEFVDNFILSLYDFSTERTAASINFGWDFATQSGNHGVLIPKSTPRSGMLPDTLVRRGISMFYIKTWVCPQGYFFDLSTDLCTLCPVANCIDCDNLTHCYTCDHTNSYYLVKAGQTLPTSLQVGEC